MRQRRCKKSRRRRPRWRLAAEPLEPRLVLTAVSPAEFGLTDDLVSPAWFTTVSEPTAVASAAGGQHASATAATKPRLSPVLTAAEEWIVRLSPTARENLNGVSEATALFAEADLGVQVIRGLGLTGQLLVRAVDTSAGISERLAATEWISYVQPNGLIAGDAVPNDPRFSELWGLNNTGSAGLAGADIDMPEAWDVSTGSSEIVVGVIDEGIDYTHVDLAANIWRNPGEIPGNGIDDDSNGFVDDVHGYDFFNDQGDPYSSEDGDSHGTHVAGTIGAVGNNEVGITGINWDVSIMSLKFLGPESGTTADLIRAINYATMMRTSYGVNVRVTNNSYGSSEFDAGERDAISASGAAGILFVAAAGNESADNDTTPSYPANYDLDCLISVAATDASDQLASFSNFGQSTVHLAAPGVDILSTVPDDGYMAMDGTSMATPHVTGVAALALAVDPTLSVAELKQLILDNVDPLPALAGRTMTGGRLNANNVLQALGLSVRSTTPAAEAVVGLPPTTFTVEFSHAVDITSVAAADLTVNDIPATTVTATDSLTLRFEFATSPVRIEGRQTIALAAGSILREADGNGLRGFESSFHYDATPLTVVASSPAAGSIVPLPLAQLDLSFSEPVDPDTVDAGDLTLSAGRVVAATLLDATTIRYQLADLNNEGTLEIELPAGRLRDLTGNPQALSKFSVVLDADAGQPLAGRFVPVGPQAGPGYRTTITGQVSRPGDEDSFQLELGIGDTIACVLTPTAGLGLGLRLVDPAGNTVASTLAEAAGETIGLLPTTAGAAGTWTISVFEQAGLTGLPDADTFTLEVLIGGGRESEDWGGGENGSPATAEPLDHFLAPIGTGRRGLVFGSLGSTAGDSVDQLSIDLDAGETLTLRLAATTADQPVLTLLGPSGTTVATATRTDLGDWAIDGFVTAVAGRHTVVTTAAAAASVSYGLLAVTDGGVELENNDTLSTATPLAVGAPMLASLGIGHSDVTGPFPHPVSGTPLSFGFTSTGDFDSQSWNGTPFLYDGWGYSATTFTLQIDGVNYNNTGFSDFAATPFPVVISESLVGNQHQVKLLGSPQSDVLFERLVSWRDGDDYALVTTTIRNRSAATLAEVALLESQDPDPGDFFETSNDVRRAGSLVIAAAADGAVGLGSTDPRVVASVDGAINDGYLLGDPQDVLRLPNDPDGFTEDTGINLAFDIGGLAPGAETSCTFAMIFGETAAAIDAEFSAIDFDVLPNDHDTYSLVLEAGREIAIETTTPGNLHGDNPDLQIELIAADGSLLASDDNSAADGRNARLRYLPTVSGSYYLRVSAANPGGGFDVGSYAIQTTAVPPLVEDSLTVTAAAVTPSGFTVTFSAPVERASLRPWAIDQTLATTVTLEGMVNGPVSGSVVLSPDGSGLSFIATGGLLPADTYSIRLAGGEDGIAASSGAVLDGDEDGMAGGDFVLHHTIADVADAVIVRLPDQVRGPGQAVMSADGREGLPLMISTGLDVSSLDVTLRYDPTLLTITDFSLDPVMSAAGVSVVSNLSEPGLISAAIFTTSSLATTPGPLELGRFIGAVPVSAGLGAAQLLEFSYLAVFDASVAVAERPSLADQAIHAVHYVGDTSGNGKIQANDAVLVARLAAGLETGLAAAPLLDPALVADVTGNGRIQSNDAVQVARRAAGIDTPFVPAIPTSSPLAETEPAAETSKLTSALVGPLPPGGTDMLFRREAKPVLPRSARDAAFAVAKWLLDDQPPGQNGRRDATGPRFATLVALSE